MSKTALVVDDSAVIRQAIGYSLREVGFEVTEGANGQEGVDRLDTDTFSVIFTDVNMPVMDGITFIGHVRSHPKQRFVPVLVVTTEGCQDMITKGRAAGATGWLIKPVSHDKIVAVLAKVVK
jgi:two-component system, chemotaxis family, chemotaxis protein CheY